jgi:UDP-N-acetylglucosamine pyrophosphorylase
MMLRNRSAVASWGSMELTNKTQADVKVGTIIDYEGSDRLLDTA